MQCHHGRRQYAFAGAALDARQILLKERPHEVTGVVHVRDFTDALGPSDDLYGRAVGPVERRDRQVMRVMQLQFAGCVLEAGSGGRARSEFVSLRVCCETSAVAPGAQSFRRRTTAVAALLAAAAQQPSTHLL